jgi:hypothetical protein
MVGADHPLTWLAPSPTWGALADLTQADNRDALVRPAILRFANDRFMDELLRTLAYQPQNLNEWRAVPETWEKPMRAPPASTALALPQPISKLSVQLAQTKQRLNPTKALVRVDPGGDPQKPLKLYQPVQLRHYLVTASLVCQRPGLPDRKVDPGKQERVSFVVRRILATDDNSPGSDPSTWDEYAYVQDASGVRWQQVTGAADALQPNEERLPLFSLAYDETPARQRRLFGGVIPVGRREAYLAARLPALDDSADAGASGSDATPDPLLDPRLLMFHMKVTNPWSELVQQSLDEIQRLEKNHGQSFPNDDPPKDGSDVYKDKTDRAREHAQTTSWYTLLDFEYFLRDHVKNVHAVLAGTLDRASLTADEEALVAWMESVVLASYLTNGLAPGATKANLLQALQALAQDPSIGEALEAVEVTYDVNDPSTPPNPGWPTFLFPLANSLVANTIDPNAPPQLTLAPYGPFPFIVGGIDYSSRGTDRDTVLNGVSALLSQLRDLVVKTLPPANTGAVPDAMPEIYVRPDPSTDPHASWFAIRCVYERPNCGPLEGPVVSAPTSPFQLAGYFDPDAPVRPVRIPLPMDISPGGLRKFPRGATLMISDMLCGQLKKIRQLSLADLVLSVLPWPFHKDLPDPGATGPCADSMGMFCSLSIPIVTLIALILLIIMVTLFDIFFHWLPLLFFCFPVRLFSGKKK